MAAAAVISTTPNLSMLSVIEIDATTTETHSMSNQLTSYPVESGEDVGDHSRPEPDRVQLDCVVSATPLTQGTSHPVSGEGGQSFTVQSRQDDSAIKNAYDALVDLHNMGKLVTLVTTLRSYPSMAVESISAARTARDAGALRFKMTLKHVRVVQNKMTTQTVAKDPRAHKKVKTGKQSATEEMPKSVAAKVLDAGTETWGKFSKWIRG